MPVGFSFSRPAQSVHLNFQAMMGRPYRTPSNTLLLLLLFCLPPYTFIITGLFAVLNSPKELEIQNGIFADGLSGPSFFSDSRQLKRIYLKLYAEIISVLSVDTIQSFALFALLPRACRGVVDHRSTTGGKCEFARIAARNLGKSGKSGLPTTEIQFVLCLDTSSRKRPFAARLATVCFVGETADHGCRLLPTISAFAYTR